MKTASILFFFTGEHGGIDIRTDYVMGALLLVVLIGGLLAWLWLRRHPDAD